MSRVLPILFNDEMVRAILDGRKTVTRRVVKFPANKCLGAKPPYQPGDILYVRETWQCWRAHRYEANADIRFKAGGEGVRLEFANGNTDSINRYDYDAFVNKWFSHNGGWHPSIHMPKEAARIWLKVTDVRVERLHDMKLDDFLSEGVVIRPEAFNDPENAYMQAGNEFARIWDSTIKKSQTVLNPWVWVIEFERCGRPEPCILRGINPARIKDHV